MAITTKKLIFSVLALVFLVYLGSVIYSLFFYTDKGSLSTLSSSIPSKVTDIPAGKNTRTSDSESDEDVIKCIPSDTTDNDSSSTDTSDNNRTCIIPPSNKMVGLVNPKNSCFINSVIQILYHSEHFRTSFNTYLNQPNFGKHGEYDEETSKVAKGLEAIFVKMDKAKQFSYFKPLTYPALPPHLRNTKQHDPFEIMTYYNMFYNFDWSPFEIEERNYKIYNSDQQPCEAPTVANTVLQLTIPDDKISTETSKQREKVLFSELVKNYYSPVSRGISDAELEIGVYSAENLQKIMKLPKTMLIKVKRVQPKQQKPQKQNNKKGLKSKDKKNVSAVSDETEKINTFIVFEEVIDFKEYLDNEFQGDFSLTKYELAGFIKHQGTSAENGHYITCLKSSKGVWFKIDDKIIKKLSSLERVKKEFSDGYIYMYNQITENDTNNGERNNGTDQVPITDQIPSTDQVVPSSDQITGDKIIT